MSAPFFVPFNFQPVSHQRGTTGTYTCPAGKYARVTVLFTCGFSFDMGNPNSTSPHPPVAISTSNQSSSFDIWLKSGDTLTLAVSNTNPSQTWINGVTYYLSLDALSELTVTHTSGVVGILNASANMYVGVTTGGTPAGAASITCNPDFSWFAQEFNELT